MTPPTNTRTVRPARRFVPVAVASVALAVGFALNDRHAFDPAWALVPLNVVFLSLVPLTVAVVAVGAYRSTGVPAVLAIGCGMLALGLGGGAVPAVLRYVTGPNATVTMHNTSVLLTGAAQLVAAAGSVILVAPRPADRRLRDVAWLYSAVAGLVALLLVGVTTETTPTFFTPDGPTDVRQFVLGLTVQLTSAAAVVWIVSYLRTPSPFVGWYVVGLMLFVAGLIAVYFQAEVGNTLGWVGRGAQYAAAIFFLVAVLSVQPSRSRSTDAAIGLSLFQSSVPLQPLLESTAEAIIVLDAAGRILFWNDAATRMFGVPVAAAFGRPLRELISTPSLEAEAFRELLARPDSAGTFRGPLAHAGSPPIEAELSMYRQQGAARRVCIIRDISAQRIAERAAQDARDELGREIELARQQAERSRYAQEVNDTIVQGLVAAEMSYDLGRDEEGRELLRSTSRQARQLIGELLGARGPLQPGFTRRRRPSHGTFDGGR